MSCNEEPGKQRSDEILALLHENNVLRAKCAGLENQLEAERARNCDLSLLCEDLSKRVKETATGLLEFEKAMEERDALIKQNEWLQKELDFAHAQLEIVFRIFPERSSCSGV